jgi:DNA-binding MarR family transcriptional regulator
MDRYPITMTVPPGSSPSTPMPGDLLALDAQFCFPVYAAAHLIQRLYRDLLAPLGLTYPQYLAMLVLWEHETVTVKALGERLLLDSGTLSPLLQRLEQRRLVKKRKDADDARRVVVSLTAKGRALRADAARVPEALVCRLLQEGGSDAAVHLGALRQQLQGLIGGLQHALSLDAPEASTPVTTKQTRSRP